MLRKKNKTNRDEDEHGTKDKNTVWLYAVVLFTSAFIVLLATAYSQLKANRNIENYRISAENEKTNFKRNINALTSENYQTRQQAEAFKSQVDALNKIISDKSKEIEELNQKSSKTKDYYDRLAQAEKNYQSGNILKCATLISENFDVSLLSEQGQERYKFLSNRTFKKAAYQAYNQGRSSYSNKDYSSAVDKFKLSLVLDQGSSVAEECHFFLAWAYYRLSNLDAAEEELNVFLKNYPNSQYKKDITQIQKNLEKT